jgi:hypothetical protein
MNRFKKTMEEGSYSKCPFVIVVGGKVRNAVMIKTEIVDCEKTSMMLSRSLGYHYHDYPGEEARTLAVRPHVR